MKARCVRRWTRWRSSTLCGRRPWRFPWRRRYEAVHVAGTVELRGGVCAGESASGASQFRSDGEARLYAGDAPGASHGDVVMKRCMWLGLLSCGVAFAQANPPAAQVNPLKEENQQAVQRARQLIHEMGLKPGIDR